MKKILGIILGILFFFGFSFARDYLYFYMEGCEHCANVDKFLTDNELYKKLNIKKYEIRFNQDNYKLLTEHYAKQGIGPDSPNYGVVPIMVIDEGTGCSSIVGDTDIIQYFEKTQNIAAECTTGSTATTGDNSFWKDTQDMGQKLKFIGLVIGAALADSINPCAFTVMLLLLSAILTKHKSYKKVFVAGFLFVLAVFLSYLLMGIGLYKALASTSNTYYLKLVVGALGLLIGLANLKDFFWYGKGFVMEVPFSRRPLMAQIISSVVSPAGAFVVGIIVSLFLLPCTSGPYFTILGYLASQNKSLNYRGYFTLIIYNLLFVLPMIGITFLVGMGFKSIDEIAKLKEKHKKNVHLIVGIIMLMLGGYILMTL